MTGVGPMLRRFRQRAGLTQQEVAQRAGISLGGLRDLEQGRVLRPRPANLRRLAEALCLSSEESAMLAGRNSGVAAGPDLRVQVLGPLTVRVDGAAVELRSAKQRALLGLLALSPNVPVPCSALVETLWECAPPATATALVRSHSSRLRRRLQPTIGDSILVAGPDSYRLAVTDEQLDVLRFRRLLGQARQHHRSGDHQRAIGLYQDVLRVWRGEPLVDVAALVDHPKVVALRREWRQAVLEFADIAGHHDQTVSALWRLIDEDPLNEAAHARLMLALFASGQQAAALGVFDRLRRRLADELGVAPGPVALEAHRRVLRREVGPLAETASTAGRLAMTVVTSRGRPGGLVPHPVTLGLLDRVGARRLLSQRLGAKRLAAEPTAVDDIIAACKGLPLALVIVAAGAVTRPHLPLARIAAELRSARELSGFASGDDPGTGLRAAFSWSYRALSPGAARLFRLLGRHPDPYVDVATAANLAGVPPLRVHPLLAELVRAHLLTEHHPGRFSCHDLLRAYAAELAVKTEASASTADVREASR
jgi:DNA-binding SARP family transcriptional activator